MICIPILVAAVAAVGIGLILLDVFRVPSYAVSKTTHNLGKKQNQKVNPVEVWLREIANWLSGKIHMNEYKRLQLESDLQTAEMNMAPELYLANAVVKASFVAVFAIPVFFLSKMIALLVLICAVILYIMESKKVGKRIREKRTRIEYELPRLVAHIDKSLIHSRDVLTILDHYRENAGEELKHELTVTVADMRSGNYEAALTRLESRVGSSMLSDIVQGLNLVLKGSPSDVYWGILSIKFADYQRQLLKQEANKAPKRVRRLSVSLLICFAMIYVVVIGQVLISSLGGLLG